MYFSRPHCEAMIVLLSVFRIDNNYPNHVDNHIERNNDFFFFQAVGSVVEPYMCCNDSLSKHLMSAISTIDTFYQTPPHSLPPTPTLSPVYTSNPSTRPTVSLLKHSLTLEHFSLDIISFSFSFVFVFLVVLFALSGLEPNVEPKAFQSGSRGSETSTLVAYISWQRAFRHIRCHFHSRLTLMVPQSKKMPFNTSTTKV